MISIMPNESSIFMISQWNKDSTTVKPQIIYRLFLNKIFIVDIIKKGFGLINII